MCFANMSDGKTCVRLNGGGGGCVCVCVLGAGGVWTTQSCRFFTVCQVRGAAGSFSLAASRVESTAQHLSFEPLDDITSNLCLEHEKHTERDFFFVKRFRLFLVMAHCQQRSTHIYRYLVLFFFSFFFLKDTHFSFFSLDF